MTSFEERFYMQKIAAEPLSGGESLVLTGAGRVARFRPYSPWERFVRAIGRKVGREGLAHYHDREVIGFASTRAAKGKMVRVLRYGKGLQ